MKRFAGVLLGICSIVAASARHDIPTTLPSDEFIVPGVRVGPVSFGMPAEQVREALGEPERITGNSWEYLGRGIAVMFTRDNPSVIAIFCGDACLRGDPLQISPLVDACKYKTAQGLGMNSSVQDVRRVLGAEADKESSDGDYTYLNYKTVGMRLTLYKGRVMHVILRAAGK